MIQQSTRSAHIKVLLSGISSLILCMGIARFAYTPLLPVMVEQAGLTHTGGGWLAAINYTGYLLGVLLASFVTNAVVKDQLYRWGMVGAVISTAMMGFTADFNVWMISRFIAGLCTSAGLMIGSGLLLNWLMRHGHRRELGIHFSGIGLGIVVSSLLAIMMSNQIAWYLQWYWLTVIASMVLIPALVWFPKPAANEEMVNQHASMQDSPPNKTFMRLFLVAYCCAGFGYVITATFIVAITNDIPALAHKGGWVFLVMGLVSAPSSYVWDLIARKVGDVNALILAGAIEVVGIIFPTFGLGVLGALIGAILYGATSIAIVSLVLTMAGRYYPSQPAKMMGKMTIAYGLAQIVGPGLIGLLAGAHGGYAIGLYFAAGIMAVGCLLFIIMRKLQ